MLNLKRLTKTAIISALSVGMTFVALQNQKASAQTPSGFYVCNESGEPLKVAYAYYNSDGTWSTRGLTTLDKTPGTCIELDASLNNNTRYYLYATSNSSDNIWQGTHPFCFSALGDLNNNAANIGVCTKVYVYHESVGNFFSVWIPDPLTGSYPSHYVYTFAPHNYVNNWNSPRAER